MALLPGSNQSNPSFQKPKFTIQPSHPLHSPRLPSRQTLISPPRSRLPTNSPRLRPALLQSSIIPLRTTSSDHSPPNILTPITPHLHDLRNGANPRLRKHPLLRTLRTRPLSPLQSPRRRQPQINSTFPPSMMHHLQRRGRHGRGLSSTQCRKCQRAGYICQVDGG